MIEVLKSTVPLSMLIFNPGIVLAYILGMEEAALGVDTQNLTGAFRLYESLGFEKVKRWTDYRKSLEG